MDSNDLYDVHKDDKNDSQQQEQDCNLSFSFNLDFYNSDSCESKDSDTVNLQIDVSEVIDYNSPSKGKRLNSEESIALNEVEEEIERQLEAKAAKTNLTSINVKNILKHVISDEQVRAMVQRQLKNTDEEFPFEPKLTRSKAKELSITQPDIPALLPATPLAKALSLIDKELSEDSSDEEYVPNEDQQSEDEREAENSVGSDVDSEPHTPVTPVENVPPAVKNEKVTDDQYDEEGIFKIPSIPSAPIKEKEESIGQRTRSKFSLSETSIEQIEQAFMPPDITTDMYDWDYEIDEEYVTFLRDLNKPLTQEPKVEDDPEADPEYNIMADEELEFLDKEEFREDKGVKIPRKEVNDLMRSLSEFADTNVKKDQEARKKRKSLENAHVQSALSVTVINPTFISVVPEKPKVITQEQCNLLAVQLQQHVQLLTQSYLLAYKHPEYHTLARACKGNLDSLRFLVHGENSTFMVKNLNDALQTIANWENKLSNPKFCEEYEAMVKEEIIVENVHLKAKLSYAPRFHPELKATMMESKALVYPQLLPPMFARMKGKSWNKFPYFRSEENLIVLGLEQFYPYVMARARKFRRKADVLIDVVQLIKTNLLPSRDLSSLVNHVKQARRSKDDNIIRRFFENGSVPQTIHYIPYNYEFRAPKDQPIEFLPVSWRNVGTEDKDAHFKRKGLKKLVTKKKEESITLRDFTVPADHPLRNPIVNVLITVPSQETPIQVTISDDTLRVPTSEAITTMANNEETPSETNMAETSRNCDDYQTDEIDPLNFMEVDDKKESSDSERNMEEGERGEDSSRLPQLRKTTPRLAKIRSAENMRLMTQVLGLKSPSSSCSSVKSKGKGESSKTDDESSLSVKGDDEDEIAELMLASTTIKKDSLSRKKAKQARELENIKRLVEAENDINREERAAKYAASFIQKLQSVVESQDPETFKSVLKLYLDYCDKISAIEHIEFREDVRLPQDTASVSSGRSNDKTCDEKNALTVKLFEEVSEKLTAYPELCSDFLLFLTPHQAAMVDKSVEYTMLQKMKEFVNVAQIYFAKQPSRLAKIMQAITNLSADPLVTKESVIDIMGPVLKGHPLVMDLFLQVLPNGKPPESLFIPHMFENLICPVGPHDKNKVYTEDAPELYENIELPVSTSQDDPYGGESCKCNCHNTVNPKLKTTSEHCASCGTRFLNGRIYLQTPEGLRPAKITFSGADKEQQENIARVSLKSTEKFLPTPPVKRRKRNSKSESSSGEASSKPSISKASPTKESEHLSASRNKRGIISPPKSGEQKKLKTETASQPGTSTPAVKKLLPLMKSTREKRAERREAKFDQKGTASPVDIKQEISTSEEHDTQFDSSPLMLNDTTDTYTEFDSQITIEKMEYSDSEESGQSEVDAPGTSQTRPWTREEDYLLLTSLKEEYKPSTFIKISKSLENRSVQDVRDRFQVLYSLMKKYGA